MRKSSLTVIACAILTSLMLTAPVASAEGAESSVFPERKFFITRSPPGAPRSDTVTVDILPPLAGEWWVTAESLAGSAVAVEVWRNDAGILALESSSKVTALRSQSTKTVLSDGSLYKATFTPFGRSGTSVLHEHFIVPSASFAEILWLRQFGTPDTDRATSLAVDDSGIYVAGAAVAALPGQTTDGPFIRKYDLAGNEVWTRQFYAGFFYGFGGIAVYSSGVYVAGWTVITLEGTSAGWIDAFVRKYDLDGNEVWTRQFGSPESDVARGIAADASGVYVIGETEGALPGQTRVGHLNAFVRKYDFDGNEVWTRQFGGADFVSASGVAVVAFGVYVVGFTSGVLPGQTSAGGWDAFIRKYDVDGNEVWTRQFGIFESDTASAVAVFAFGVYVAGVTSFPGNTDAFIRKYDLEGNEVWTRQVEASHGDVAFGIAVSILGVYIAGETDGTLPGQTALGGGDAFVRKYDLDGNEVWTLQFGSSHLDMAFGVAVNFLGVHVAGETQGDLPGWRNAGLSDAFVVRLTT
ncbi:MAG TPA: hypothetical protein VJP78_12295 [Thermoleophilia bacterium]|nr:hypothetical protein [Thermoleophilia bacterium]